jgi:hypothetical protein
MLRDVISGAESARVALLHNCRLEGAGTSAYGRDEILSFFRNAHSSPDWVQLVEGIRCAALFTSDASGPTAVFADLYEGRINRLWYLASTALALASAQRIDVPFDPAVGETEPRVAFDPADHPDLQAAHVDRVHSWSTGLLEGDGDETPLPRIVAGLSRPRLGVLRAFSSGDLVAVLAMLNAQRDDGRAGIAQFLIAARLTAEHGTGATTVIDEGGRQAELARTWRPAL